MQAMCELAFSVNVLALVIPTFHMLTSTSGFHFVCVCVYMPMHVDTQMLMTGLSTNCSPLCF